MDTTDSGTYYGHVSISCGSNNNIEWCTPKVKIVVRNCSAGELYINVIIACVLTTAEYLMYLYSTAITSYMFEIYVFIML